MKVLPEGPMFVEGSLTDLRIAGTGGTVVTDGLRPMRELSRPIYQGSVPAGHYALTSVERPCAAACPALDPPVATTRCRLEFEVRPGTTTQVAIVISSRRGRAVTECTTETLSRAEYQEALFGILEKSSGLATAYTDLVVRKRPQRQCTRMMWRFTRKAQRLVGGVADLRPPADAAPVQRRFLLAANRSIGKLIDAAIAVENGELSCGRELNARIYGMPSTRRAEAAMAELEKLGYHLGLG